MLRLAHWLNEFSMTGNLKEWDGSGRAPEITLPTLFTCGRYAEITPAGVQASQRLVQGSEMVVCEESAHMAQLEETDRYLQYLRDFLRRAESHQIASARERKVV